MEMKRQNDWDNDEQRRWENRLFEELWGEELSILGKIVVCQTTNKSSAKETSSRRVVCSHCHCVVVGETTNIAKLRSFCSATAAWRPQIQPLHKKKYLQRYVCIYQPSYNIIKIHFVVYQRYNLLFIQPHSARVRCIKFVLHMFGKCEFSSHSVCVYVCVLCGIEWPNQTFTQPSSQPACLIALANSKLQNIVSHSIYEFSLLSPTFSSLLSRFYFNFLLLFHLQLFLTVHVTSLPFVWMR